MVTHSITTINDSTVSLLSGNQLSNPPTVKKNIPEATVQNHSMCPGFFVSVDYAVQVGLRARVCCR